MPASILTVDDEDTTTIALELLLRDHGYEVKSAVNAAEAQALLARHWFDLVFLDLRLPDADGITLLEEIKRIAPETEVVLMTLFFFGMGKEQSLLLKEAAANGWSPHMFLLGAFGGKELPPVSAQMKDKVFLAFPTLPADLTREGVNEFRALHEKYKFAPRHTASQLAAFATAKVFVEGLTRAGKDLSREKLITALEGFYEYDTGATPLISFGPNRRVGAAGAHVLPLEQTATDFATASAWVKAY
jgi:CheY-like chemotaxis protein